MDLKELQEKAWSLRSEHDPQNMKCLGSVVKKGYRYTYYEDETGEIYYESEPEDGKPEWMLLAERAAKRKRRIRY